MGDVEHHAVLRSLLDDPERSVRTAAETALERLSVRVDLRDDDPPANRGSG
jgi:hypothetical protein